MKRDGIWEVSIQIPYRSKKYFTPIICSRIVPNENNANMLKNKCHQSLWIKQLVIILYHLPLWTTSKGIKRKFDIIPLFAKQIIVKMEVSRIIKIVGDKKEKSIMFKSLKNYNWQLPVVVCYLTKIWELYNSSLKYPLYLAPSWETIMLEEYEARYPAFNTASSPLKLLSP